MAKKPQRLDAISELLRVDPKLGKPILVGAALITLLTMFVAVADTQDLSPFLVIGLLLLLILALYVISNIVHNKVLQAILGWFFIAVLILYVLALFIATVAPGRTPIPPQNCLLQFWRPCTQVKEETWRSLPAKARLTRLGEAEVQAYGERDTASTPLFSLAKGERIPSPDTPYTIWTGTFGGTEWYKVEITTTGRTFYIPAANVVCQDVNNNNC